MKKVVEYGKLVEEVRGRVKEFRVTEDMMGKQLEDLVDREIIAKGDGDIYKYVP